MPKRHDTQFLDAGCEVLGHIVGSHYTLLYTNPGVQMSSRTALEREPTCDEIIEQGGER